MPDAPAPLRPSYVNVFPSDWKAGTSMMTDREEWTYLQICLHNWDKGEALPKRLQQGALGRNPEWVATVADLLEMGKVTATASGALMVTRAMTSYRVALQALEKKSRSGKAGAKSRWENNDKAGDAKPPDGQNGDMIFSVPAQAWADFREHRNKLRRPMTDAAERAILKKLETFQTEYGHDPVKVLERTMTRGWLDVFPLKGDQDDNRNRDSGNGLFDALRE